MALNKVNVHTVCQLWLPDYFAQAKHCS